MPITKLRTIKTRGIVLHLGPDRESDGMPATVTTEIGKTHKTPPIESLRSFLFGDDRIECLDGCEMFEPDGICQHGSPTWLIAVEMV